MKPDLFNNTIWGWNLGMWTANLLEGLGNGRAGLTAVSLVMVALCACFIWINWLATERSQ